MLSYMLPVEEKPPPVPGKGHMQLALGPDGLANGRTSSPISKETSISSFISDATTATASHSSMTPTSTSDKGKPKLIVNGGKHQTLKRVSFGSSKGSMVETLIFESPVQEETEPSPIPEIVNPFPEDQDQTEAEREKVRVTFFQQSKPQEVDLPDEPVLFNDTDFMMATQVAMNETNHIVYNRMESTESGWENPFRPGGDLSREADEIVELIKGGKPITPTPGSAPSHTIDQIDQGKLPHSGGGGGGGGGGDGGGPITQSPKKATELQATPKSANGNVKNDNKSASTSPGAVNIKRGTVKPDGDASQVEHVTIKKKPKCKCCVIQ